MDQSENYRTRSSTEEQRVLQTTISAFQQALDRGTVPPLERFLEQTPHAQLKQDLLISLLRLEWTYHLQKGKTPALEPYLARFPAHQDWIRNLYQQIVAPHARKEPSDSACYYLRNRTPIGPFSWDQFRLLARAGDLRPKDQVHISGRGDWQEAGQVNGLFPQGGESKAKELTAGDFIRPDYMLLEQVGHGGMGDVYKVFRTSLRREYALKIVRPYRYDNSPPAQQRQVEQFQKEMQLTAKLRHDHIVIIHDTGEHFGLPFYTMDFVGESLANRVHNGPLPGRKAAEYIAKVARAVDHANRQGILHRDIKPHNILLDQDKPLLADLGLAAAMEKVWRDEGGSDFAGTPPYMAPEQARGGALDARTDVYGLGATLYHLITGRPPHQSPDRQQILRQVVTEEPLPPGKLNASLDRNLEAIVLKSLDKKPEGRYPTALALAEDLERFLQGYPVSAKIPTLMERCQKWGRREPIKAGLAAAIVFLLVTLFVVQTVGNSRLRGALEETQQARDIAEKNEREAKDLKIAAELERDRAASEREKASALANILGMRVLNKTRQDDDSDKAMDNLRKQIDLEERQWKAGNPDEPTLNGIKLDLAENYRSLANLLLQTRGKVALPEATQLLEKCVAVQADVSKALPILKVELALNSLDLATIYGQVGRLNDELKFDSRALEMLEEVRKEGYNDAAILAAVGEAHLALGVDYTKRGQKPIALKHQKKAVEVLDGAFVRSGSGLLANHSYQRQLGRAYQALGNNLELEDPREAMAYLERAEKIFADKSQYRMNLAEVYLGLGKLHTKKEPDLALPPLKKAAVIAEQLVRDAPPTGPQLDLTRILHANVLSALGLAYGKKDELKVGEDFLQRSLDLRKKVGTDAVIADGYSDVFHFHANARRWKEAIQAIDFAITLQDALVKNSAEDYAKKGNASVFYFNKSICMSNLGNHDGAQECLLRAKGYSIEAFRQAHGSPHFAGHLLRIFDLLEKNLRQRNRDEEAAKLMSERTRVWWSTAEELARTVGKEPDVKLDEVIAFFEHGLSNHLLDADRISMEAVFQPLRARPEFARLLRK